MTQRIFNDLTEDSRRRLIGELATLLRVNSVPAEARAAGLTLIGWLARRMPQDTEQNEITAPARARVSAR